MLWLVFYLWIAGAINDLVMTAYTEEVDMTDWKTHLNILAWPVTFPLALFAGIIAALRER
jgi:hypothetical protein